VYKLINKLKSDSNLLNLLQGSGITFILKIFGMFLGYLLLLLIAREYGGEGVGLYTMTINIIMFAVMLSSLGINISILRYVGEYNTPKNQYKLKLIYKFILITTIPLSITVSIILYNYAGLIALELFNNPLYIKSLKLASYIIPIMTINIVSIEFLRGLRRLKISEFSRSVLIPLLTIIFLTLGLIDVFKYIEADVVPIYCFALSVFLTCLVVLKFIYKNIKNIIVEDEQTLQTLPILKTSLPMMVTSVASFGIINISLMMVEMFMSTDQVGLISLCLKLSMLISLVLVVVNSISASEISKLYWNGEHIQLQKTINHASKLIFFLSLPLAALFFVVPKMILSIFGDEFVGGVIVLQILVVSQLINAVTGSVGVFLNMTGNQKVLQNVTILALFTTLMLNYFLIPLYGINGAAYGILAGTIILNIVPAFYVQYKLGFSTFYIPKFFTMKDK